MTITGTNLTGASEVKFGATKATASKPNRRPGHRDLPGRLGHRRRDRDDPRRHEHHRLGRPVHLHPGPDGHENRTDQRPGRRRHHRDDHRHEPHGRQRSQVRRRRKATGVKAESATKVTATSPAGSGTVHVTVTTPGGTSATSAADEYTYIPAPTVTKVEPTSGPAAGGTTVTITGTNLTGASEVKFGAAKATGLKAESATKVTATSPAGSGTVRRDRDAPPEARAPPSAADEYTYIPAPTVTKVEPTSGPAAGGTTVTITGTNLTGASEVKFGATKATGLKAESATQVTATSPAGSGTVHVTVSTPGGTSATSAADEYTYIPAPTVTQSRTDQRPGRRRHHRDDHRHEPHGRQRSQVRRDQSHRRQSRIGDPGHRHLAGRLGHRAT